MKRLTKNQEDFVNDVFSGMSQIDAYKNNYKTKGWKDKSIIEKASHLMAKDNVRSRYNELLRKHEEKSLLTRETFEMKLIRALDMAIGDNETPIAVKQRTPYFDDEDGVVQGCFEEDIINAKGKNADLRALASIAGQIMKFKGWDKENDKTPEPITININPPAEIPDPGKKE